MNKIICLILLSFPFFVIAQQTQGTVKYKETVKFDIKLPPEMAEQMKGRIPKERSFPKELLFTAESSLYKDADRTAEDGPGGRGHGHGGGRGGMRMRMSMMRAESRMFKNLEEGTTVEQKDFMDKVFLIEGEKEKFAWKIAMAQKEIGGYLCQKATYKKDSTINVAVWFSPQIPVSTGPGNLGGLPGLILEANFNDGKRVITMQEINFDTPDAEVLVQPKKGKKVTDEEFRAIQKEKMEEMRKEMGGGPGGAHGNMIIIRN